MKIAIIAATQSELSRIQEKLNSLTEDADLQLSFFATGVGVMATTYALEGLIDEWQPDLVLQVGIAGAFRNNLALGDVVAVRSDCSGDMVVVENGRLLDLFDLNLQDANAFPYQDKKLTNPWLDKLPLENIKVVDAVTISEITTNPERIQQLQDKYGAQIETMEGAPMHFVGLETATPFLQVKAISNYVGERNKRNWKIEEALDNLATVVMHIVQHADEALLKKEFS